MKYLKKEIKRTVPFKIASNKKKKLLGTKFKQGAIRAFTENDKTLMKETKDTNTWKDSPCSLIRRINIVKYPYYLKPSIVSVQSLLKFQ